MRGRARVAESQADPPQALGLFEALIEPGRQRARHRPQLLASLALHGAVAAALLLLPVLLSDPLPAPRDEALRIFFYYDPPPPPPPPVARGAGLGARWIPRATPTPSGPALVTPLVPVPASEPPAAPASPGTSGGDPEGSVVGHAEGMEGGVEGGVVGGVPGGVLGGVIGGTGSDPVPVAKPDRPPKPIFLSRPVYPQDAFVEKLEGTVLLEILIDERGRVVRAHVLRSIPQLDAAAVEAVRSWLFVPAFHAGSPVASIALAPVSFRIY